MQKKKNYTAMILIALLLLLIMLLDTWILFNQTHSQTTQAGAYQLESVSGKLESTISDAEGLTMALALKAREVLYDKDELESKLYEWKDEVTDTKTGAFNVYIAGSDFCIIPDFDMPADYNATERVWYTGAVRNQGRAYVSSPYQDAMTGEICYSVSVMLGDGDAVLGVDYTMEGIQSYISQMADHVVNAAIVTDEGIIAGCSDQSKVGKRLVTEMPDYAGIYASTKHQEGVVAGRVKDGLLYENLFAARSGNGWYFIVGISDWELYKNAYIQLLTTIILAFALFIVIIALFRSALKSRERAEEALASREEFLSRISGELAEPLNRIMSISNRENVSRMEDYEEAMASVHSAGEQLSEKLRQIMSYNSILATYKTKDVKKNSRREVTVYRRFRGVVVAIMIVVMGLTLYTITSSTYSWGKTQVKNEVDKYENRLSEWINTQKSILDMFVSTISTNPAMLDDYEGTVEYLRKITSQYSEISVTYMTNPEFEHTVYMSNGWEPDADWHVEERQWYIDTVASEKGWSISAPYFDDQTGGYCLTISKMVYDAETGEFLGVFGIDFFMEKLVDILGDSYTQNNYAFLVDPEGEIINHPYGAYQMTPESSTNVQSLPYGETRADGNTIHLLRDYDGGIKVVTATRNNDSRFTVYVVSNAWNVFGHMIVYGVICAGLFIFCIVLIYRLLTAFINWQENTNRELAETADTAIAAGKAKSSFLAQMSHEIRTPINAVLGMNEMILRESDDADIRDYAENIKSSGRTLLSLINSILDFSKIEDGKMELVSVKYDVASMINDLVNSIEQRARAKNLEFELQVDETIPCTLFGDDVRIRQIIMNLLTNAVKYTEKGRVTLKIRKIGTQGTKIILYVVVKDTGIGIREEDREKLFETFERLDETRNRNIEGTGLGMSIVTRLLDMMGSSLYVDSEYGKGSEFSFELLQEVIDKEPIGPYEKRYKKNTEKSNTEQFLFARDVSILVVDDNEMNRKVAKSLMKRNGIVPDEAASGAEAIEMISHKRYDMVLLDHMMPQMDGVETLKNIKEMGLKNDTAIIALTANAVSGAEERYLKLGFDDYLSKPIEVAQMEEKLASWLPKDKVEWRVTEENTRQETKQEETAEVMEFSPEKDLDSSEDEKDDLVRKLEKNGFDTAQGLGFCGDDTVLYREILSDFVNDKAERKAELDKQFGDNDWKAFEVNIHAMKSVAKTLGAAGLSEEAYELEKAAGEENAAMIREKYPVFVEHYIHVTDILEQILG